MIKYPLPVIKCLPQTRSHFPGCHGFPLLSDMQPWTLLLDDPLSVTLFSLSIHLSRWDAFLTGSGNLKKLKPVPFLNLAEHPQTLQDLTIATK